ncbi:unnamed protein product [Rhizophagus irregularis]|nr:unnamed protein product [Rhizophagus irregularis]
MLPVGNPSSITSSRKECRKNFQDKGVCKRVKLEDIKFQYKLMRDDAEGRKIIDFNGHATFVCRWCISHFTHQQEIHDKHVAICRGLKKTPQADRMPSVKKGNDKYEFKNWKRRMQVPYYFVADFEALVRYDGVSESQKIFTGENAAQKFVIEMLNEAEAIHNEFRNPMEMMPLTIQEQASYDNAIKLLDMS